MNWQKITDMPFVISILKKAEEEIKEMTGKAVTLTIKEVNISLDEKKAILQETVCDYFDISWNKIVSKSQKGEIINARHAYMYFARKINKYSVEEIGMDCGGRDHTSVSYAHQKIEGFYKVKDDFIVHLENIKKLLPKDIFKNENIN